MSTEDVRDSKVPAFEVTVGARRFKIFANGHTEGFLEIAAPGEGVLIMNRIPHLFWDMHAQVPRDMDRAARRTRTGHKKRLEG
jgi:hypothetical protein